MLQLRVVVLGFVILWAGSWQAGADDIEGVAYGSKILLKTDGTWTYLEESIQAKDKDGKAVELKGDNTWEYVEVELNGTITFRIAALNDYQEAEVKRDDEGEVIGVEVSTTCLINLEVGNTLDVPIHIASLNVVGEIADVEWLLISDDNIVPPGEKSVYAPGGRTVKRVLYSDRMEVTLDEKKTLTDSFGCKALEGMTLLLLTESLATEIETVPPAATDVDIVSVVQTLPHEVVNFKAKWRK